MGCVATAASISSPIARVPPQHACGSGSSPASDIRANHLNLLPAGLGRPAESRSPYSVAPQFLYGAPGMGVEMAEKNSRAIRITPEERVAQEHLRWLRDAIVASKEAEERAKSYAPFGNPERIWLKNSANLGLSQKDVEAELAIIGESAPFYQSAADYRAKHLKLSEAARREKARLRFQKMRDRKSQSAKTLSVYLRDATAPHVFVLQSLVWCLLGIGPRNRTLQFRINGRPPKNRVRPQLINEAAAISAFATGDEVILASYLQGVINSGEVISDDVRFLLAKFFIKQDTPRLEFNRARAGNPTDELRTELEMAQLLHAAELIKKDYESTGRGAALNLPGVLYEMKFLKTYDDTRLKRAKRSMELPGATPKKAR
jgi:hypothetical protein